MPEPALRFTGLDLEEEVVAALQAVLPSMAEHIVTAVTVEVPSYADAFSGRMGQIIENAVQMALGAFLRLAVGAHGSDPAPTLAPALEGAYELGRGEARQGRSMDALLSAYRVGARIAWRELSETAVAADMPAETVARFAELVFAFIDELSASSLTGHADELATTGRVRQRYLERLARQLLVGEPVEMLQFSADRAGWQAPETLTAVLLAEPQTRGLAPRFGRSTLLLTEDLPGIETSEPLAVLLVPGTDDRDRGQLRSALQGRGAVLGPARPWMHVESSYRRALRARELRIGEDVEVVDTDEHLVQLVLTADREAAEDLRRRGPGPPGGFAAQHRRAAGRDAEILASAPGSARCRRGRPLRARANGALPLGPAARTLRRQPQRSADDSRTYRGAGDPAGRLVMTEVVG